MDVRYLVSIDNVVFVKETKTESIRVTNFSDYCSVVVSNKRDFANDHLKLYESSEKEFISVYKRVLNKLINRM